MSSNPLLDPSKPFGIMQVITHLTPDWLAAGDRHGKEIPAIVNQPPRPPTDPAVPFFPEAIGNRILIRADRLPHDEDPLTARLKTILALTAAIGCLVNSTPETLRTMAAIQDIDALRTDPCDALLLETLTSWSDDWKATATVGTAFFDAAGINFLLLFLKHFKDGLDAPQRRVLAKLTAAFIGSDPAVHPLAHLIVSEAPIGIAELISNEEKPKEQKAWPMELWKEANRTTADRGSHLRSYDFWSDAIHIAVQAGPFAIVPDENRFGAVRNCLPRLRHFARCPKSTAERALRGPRDMRTLEAYRSKGQPEDFFREVQRKLGRRLRPEELGGLLDRGTRVPGFPLQQWRTAIATYTQGPEHAS